MGVFPHKYKLKLGQHKKDFWTVQVKLRTVQDADLTISGEILGQYMVIFQQNKRNVGYVQVKIGTV
jgi:hypothetical protein